MEDLLDIPDTTFLPVIVTDVVGESKQNGVWTNSDELVLLTDNQGLGFSDDFVGNVIADVYGITNFIALMSMTRFQLNIHAARNVIGFDFARRYSMELENCYTWFTLTRKQGQGFGWQD